MESSATSCLPARWLTQQERVDLHDRQQVGPGKPLEIGKSCWRFCSKQAILAAEQLHVRQIIEVKSLKEAFDFA